MNLKQNLRLARLFFLLLAIFATGRWIMGLNVPYERGTGVFSVVTLSVISGIYYAAFARRWRGYRVGQAVVLAMLLALATQLVVLLSTLASYAAGLDSYWNHPTALLGPDADLARKVPFGEAMAARAFGLVVNTFVSGSIAGALGWAMGGLLPKE
jgi:hypothetical protein